LTNFERLESRELQHVIYINVLSSKAWARMRGADDLRS